MPGKKVPSSVIGNLYRENKNRGEGARKVAQLVEHLIAPVDEGGQGKTIGDFSFMGLARELGVSDPMNPNESLKKNLLQESEEIGTDILTEDMFSEANPGVNTTLFKQITANLIHTSVIAGYEDDSSFIGDRLTKTLPLKLRNQKIAGFKSLAGPTTVNEGFPYQESGFEEKYVTTSETKKGRIISINEELMFLDQTGEIGRRAEMIGFYLRQEREKTIVRGVTDADQGSSIFVWRPQGTGETLYNTDGSNKNWIGSGNTTDSAFNAAVALVDWTDVEFARRYRAVAPVDDRIDGTQEPIAGLNGSNLLLVPEALFGTGTSIVRSTTSETVDNQANAATNRSNFPTQRLITEVLSSPFIDSQGGQAVNDWYYGRPDMQFVWTELWPMATFVQRGDSESAFERDTILRIKVRYYGGITATDSIWFTKIDGA